MDPDQIRDAIREVTWYHQIDLGSGIITPGTDNTLARLAMIGLPEDLRGRTVLDIGAWDGAFSFEAERRGADRRSLTIAGIRRPIRIGSQPFEIVGVAPDGFAGKSPAA
jgi:hypothetical protein